MPKNVTKTRSWRDKLDPEGLAFLDAHRVARSAYRVPDGQIRDLGAWLRDLGTVVKDFPEPPDFGDARTITLDKDFIELLKLAEMPLAHSLKEGDNEVVPGLADMLEGAQTCAALLERGPQARLQIYLVIGFGYRLLRPLWEHSRFEQFGKDPLDQEKLSKLIALGLETAAKLLRGQWKPPKGRIDGELVGLVNVIQWCSSAPLTPKEMHEAVSHAGISVPDGDAWKVWLHRARKRKLVDPPKAHKEIEIALNEDGSVDLSSLNPESMRALQRAFRKHQRIAADAPA